MKNNCQIFTPGKYVDVLLDNAGFDTNIFGENILENSFGNGNVLVEIVRRYIEDGKKQLKSLEEIKKSMENNIYGFEIDEKCINTTKLKLDELAKKFKIFNVKWKLYKQDYLLTNLKVKFAYILGNPPYIKYRDLDKDSRAFLKDRFQSCRRGKFDYCYPFIEKSISELSESGRLAYILPNSIFKNVFAEDLRSIMRPYLTLIKDYKDIRIFDDALTSSVMLFLDKKSHDISSFLYRNEKKNEEIQLNKNLLDSKWIFVNNKPLHRKKRFGDNFNIANTIATQYNKAFIISDYIDQDDKYIMIGNHLVEKELLRPTGSPKA